MSSPRVVVLDHGSGNLRSAERALSRAGADVTVTGDLRAARDADGLVVPGVGAYRAVMEGIRALGAEDVVRGRVESGDPVLGICVGMQVLYELGEEHGDVTEGLGLLPGRVTALPAPVLPHMGWNTVTPAAGSRLLADLPADTRFYFVHSYAAPPDAGPGVAVSTAEHGAPFAAVVEKDALAATQFHPEKSGDAGAALLRRWVESL